MLRSLATLVFTIGSLNAAFRPPAVPLVTSDPYFSVWSMADHLTDDVTRHWTGKAQPLSSLIRIDGVTYRLMGKEPSRVPALPQTSVTVHPTRTVYLFEGAGLQVEFTFTSPLLMTDLDLLSRPVTYIRWNVAATDSKKHDVQVYLDASALLSVNTPDQAVTESRVRAGQVEVLRAGSTLQPVLGKAGDDLRIDWGYLYLVSPSPHMTLSVASHQSATTEFATSGMLPRVDDLNLPRAAGKDSPVLALEIELGSVGKKPALGYASLAYDDLFSIEFLERKMRPYWRRNGAGTAELIQAAMAEPEALLLKCKQFDDSLEADLERVGGREYAVLGSLAYRQGLAAQKLVADVDGTPLLFPKENFSNGCIGTVDILYPQSPQLLLYHTGLLKASITPILEYASLQRWRFPFAPHDLGTYPLANGQVYGGGEKTEEDQMPVEESANMILLVAATIKEDGTPDYAVKYWPLLSKWAAYLREKGLDPENQLCTDDFAGHLAHNVNLSAKAVVALGAYAEMCNRTGHKQDGTEYRQLAEQFAAKWMQMARDTEHFKLTFDGPGTWSQKYNLVWDQLLGLNLFPKARIQQEIASYPARFQKYGLPLDSRKTYTKLDWTLWTATMADNKSEFEEFVKPLYKWADETPTRVPLTDWYDTVSGKQEGFQARSVVGGLFIRLLAEPRPGAR